MQWLSSVWFSFCKSFTKSSLQFRYDYSILHYSVFEIVVAILALYAIHLLLKMCDQTNVKAYEKLGFIAFGTPGKVRQSILAASL